MWRASRRPGRAALYTARVPSNVSPHLRPEIARRMHDLLPGDADRPELNDFYRMLRDYPERGGKGIRSELMLQSALAHGVQAGGAAWEAALWLAASIELFQNWVLIHDDIADDSEERRGRPALHRIHGVPLALNAGDALHAYMWAAALRAGVPGAPEELLGMVNRTAEGQHLDLAWVDAGRWDLTEDDYLQMVRLKTSYYTVVVPLRLGALVAGRAPDARFTAAGLHLGAAFQIRDDVLNLVADAHAYGKEIGGDLLEGKRTLINLRWLAGAPLAQREVFLQQMALPRTAKDPQAIREVMVWMLASGVLDGAQAVAAQEAGAGLALLEAALQDLPGRDAAASILAVTRQLAIREA